MGGITKLVSYLAFVTRYLVSSVPGISQNVLDSQLVRIVSISSAWTPPAVLVSQPDERYITHVTTKRKIAKEIYHAIVEYLEATDQLCTFNVPGADSCLI